MDETAQNLAFLSRPVLPLGRCRDCGATENGPHLMDCQYALARVTYSYGMGGAIVGCNVRIDRGVVTHEQIRKDYDPARVVGVWE